MSLWELFGFRGWSLTDMADVDTDTLDELILAARRHESARRQQ